MFISRATTGLLDFYKAVYRGSLLLVSRATSLMSIQSGKESEDGGTRLGAVYAHASLSLSAGCKCSPW